MLLVGVPAALRALFRIYIMHWVSAPVSEQSLVSWRLDAGLYVGIILLSAGLGGLLIPNIFLEAGNALHN